MSQDGPDSIGVYMKGEDLAHKISMVGWGVEGSEVYWRLSRVPKYRQGLKRLYAATSKQWLGYFDIKRLDIDNDPYGPDACEVILGDWHFIPPSLRMEYRSSSVFRGFNYFGFTRNEKHIRGEE